LKKYFQSIEKLVQAIVKTTTTTEKR